MLLNLLHKFVFILDLLTHSSALFDQYLCTFIKLKCLPLHGVAVLLGLVLHGGSGCNFSTLVKDWVCTWFQDDFFKIIQAL